MALLGMAEVAKELFDRAQDLISNPSMNGLAAIAADVISRRDRPNSHGAGHVSVPEGTTTTGMRWATSCRSRSIC